MNMSKDLKIGRPKKSTPISIGDKFCQLTVLEKQSIRTGIDNMLRWVYLCECECGNMTTVEEYKLRSGHTRSCGCLLKKIEN